MPSPLSLQLTSRIRRLLPAIESGVTAGLSSRAINAAIVKATGSGVRRQTLLDIIREIKGIQTAGESLQFVRLDRAPNPSRVPTALTPIRRAFGSTVRIEGTLFDTGETITRHVQVTHDSVLTRGQIEDIAASFLEDEESEYGINLERVLLVKQVRRA